MPFSSIVRMSVASVKRAGGWVKCCAGTKLSSSTTSPSCSSGSAGLLLLLLVVAAFLIDGGIARKLEAAGAGAEGVLPRRKLDAHAVVDGVCHLAGEKAAPDQAVQAVLARPSGRP